VWSVVKDGGNRFTAVDVHGRVENATRQEITVQTAHSDLGKFGE
jgi:hypothetical protein